MVCFLSIWSKMNMMDWFEGYGWWILVEVDSINVEVVCVVVDLVGLMWILGFK